MRRRKKERGQEEEEKKLWILDRTFHFVLVPNIDTSQKGLRSSFAYTFLRGGAVES